MRALLTNISIYYKINFRNVFLFISSYLMPIIFYLMFSIVFVSLSSDNKNTVIVSMCLFAITMNSIISLPASVITYAIGDINRSYIVGGISLVHVFIAICINNIINCFIISGIIVVTAPIFFGAVLPPSMFAFVGKLALCIVLSTLIGMFIGMVCKSESISIVVSQCIFLPSLFLSGLMMPVSLLPGAMRSVAKVFPLTHMLKFINDNSQNSFIYIISAIVICFAIVGYRYKKISIAQ